MESLFKVQRAKEKFSEIQSTRRKTFFNNLFGDFFPCLPESSLQGRDFELPEGDSWLIAHFSANLLSYFFAAIALRGLMQLISADCIY